MSTMPTPHSCWTTPSVRDLPPARIHDAQLPRVGVPCEQHLAPGREDAHLVVCLLCRRRHQKRGLGEVGPRRERLHLLLRETFAINHDGEAIASGRHRREHVALNEASLAHRAHCSLLALDRLAHGLCRDGSTFVTVVIRPVSLEKPSVREEVNPNIALGAFEVHAPARPTREMQKSGSAGSQSPQYPAPASVALARLAENPE
jgi:hypothetical protein